MATHHEEYGPMFISLMIRMSLKPGKLSFQLGSSYRLIKIRVLLQRPNQRYVHSQLFTSEEEFAGASDAQKKGIVAGHGGTWNLARAAKPVNPEKSLASSVQGWHSDCTIQIMAQENTLIAPRERSPNQSKKLDRRGAGIGRMEMIKDSFRNGKWRKRFDKYMDGTPFQRDSFQKVSSILDQVSK
jgi:hypothetical protein